MLSCSVIFCPLLLTNYSPWLWFTFSCFSVCLVIFYFMSGTQNIICLGSTWVNSIYHGLEHGYTGGNYDYPGKELMAVVFVCLFELLIAQFYDAYNPISMLNYFIHFVLFLVLYSRVFKSGPFHQIMVWSYIMTRF